MHEFSRLLVVVLLYSNKRITTRKGFKTWQVLVIPGGSIFFEKEYNPEGTFIISCHVVNVSHSFVFPFLLVVIVLHQKCVRLERFFIPDDLK